MLILDFQLDKNLYQAKVQNVLMANLIRPLVSVGALGAQHPQISREIHLKAFISSNSACIREKSWGGTDRKMAQKRLILG